MTETVKQSVAQYLTMHINNSEKTQRQIAIEIGYTKPNIITMFKKGHTKLPLEKIGPIAKALEITPDELFFKVMTEYMPETFEALSPFMCGKMLSKEELELIDNYRAFKKLEDERLAANPRAKPVKLRYMN
jgi:transcriptional regulator with XRE-family HTH domain